MRGTMALGDRSVDLLQAAGEASPGVVLSVMNDAGGMLAVEGGMLLGTGYTVDTYGIAEVATGATLDSLPTARQMEGWFAKLDQPPLAGRSRTPFAADGGPSIEVSPSALR